MEKNNWEMVEFSKIFNFEKKSKIKAGSGLALNEGEYPFYTSSNELTKSLNEFIFDDEYLIFGTGGKASIHYQNSKFAVSTDCFVTKLKEEFSNILLTKFVYRYLSGNIRILEEGFKGAGLKHISKTYIQHIKIPLPPLSIQKEIVKKLEVADALRQKDKALLQQYDSLAQSIFYQMFGDPVLNKKGWDVKELGELLTLIQIGPFGSQLHTYDYVEDGIPVINPTHIVNEKIVPDYSFSITEQKYKELEKYAIQKKDIILGRRGDIGRNAVANFDFKLLCGTGSIILRTKSINPIFLSFMFNHTTLKNALEENASGATMLNLNKTIIKNFKLITPPLPLQNQFAAIIENIEQQKAVVQQQAQQSEDLFQALLQESFG